MALAGHAEAAALGADDVAEYVALDGRGGDGERRLQDKHQRRDQSHGARNTYPADVLPHGLP